jgi:hypothetical protein
MNTLIIEAPWDVATHPEESQRHTPEQPAIDSDASVSDWLCYVEEELNKPGVTAGEVGVRVRCVERIVNQTEYQFLRQCLKYIEDKERRVKSMGSIKMDSKEALILDVIRKKCKK